MARVLLLALRFWPATGGVEARTWEVARRLAKAHDITVLASDLKRERPFERFAPGDPPSETEGLRVVRLRAVRRAPVEGYGVHLAGLRAALRDGLARAQVLDAHPYGAAHTDVAVPMAKQAGVAVALTAHFHPAETAAHPALRALYDGLRGGPTLRRADKVVAVTELEARALERGFRVPRDRVAVIPNGIDTKRFRDLAQPREPGLMLGVGRLAPVKGFDLAVATLAKLREGGQEARLVLAGEDWGEGEALRALAQRLGVADRVEFAGRVAEEDLVRLYNRASVLLAPSRYEAFGITVLEALACGCPAVVSNVGGLPAALGRGGVAVPRDVAYWVSSVGSLLRSPDAQQRFRQQGQAHAADHDWDRVAAQVDGLWRGLAG
jgi:glycosyltransferase involved in cell wall biosynthesis